MGRVRCVEIFEGTARCRAPLLEPPRLDGVHTHRGKPFGAAAPHHGARSRNRCETVLGGADARRNAPLHGFLPVHRKARRLHVGAADTAAADDHAPRHTRQIAESGHSLRGVRRRAHLHRRDGGGENVRGALQGLHRSGGEGTGAADPAGRNPAYRLRLEVHGAPGQEIHARADCGHRACRHRRGLRGRSRRRRASASSPPPT